MTEEQVAINRLMCGNTAHSRNADYIKTAIKALEEIQQYRAIGAVEEFKAFRSDDFTGDLLNMGYTKGLKDGYAKAIEEFAEQFCAACCGNTFHATINGIKNVEMMTLDGVTETIFEVAEKMKGSD